MTTTQEYIDQIAARLHNGQCPHGEWLDADDLPEDTVEAIASVIVEDGLTHGRITVGGQSYEWDAR